MGAAASSQHPIASTDYVQEDLWLEILKRLPVKSICRFRCVCKSWNSLFSSPFFITLHHNSMMISHMPTNQKSYFMMDQLERPNIPGYVLYHPHQRHAGSECITNMGLPFPVQDLREFRGFRVLDVIHGVVCLASGLGESHIVWNPTTRKHISLPTRQYGYEDGILFRGFGFSAAKSDFKMVVFLSNTPYYDIISVQDGLWRRSSLPDDLFQGYSPISKGIFLDGTIYWMAGSMTNEYIFCMLLFDCEREEFKSMEFPELGGIQRLNVEELFKFSDKLALLRRGESFQLPLELWVMEESTWKKLFNVENVFRLSSLVNHDILVAEDGNIFAAGRDELSSVDLPFDSGTLHQPVNGHVFRESLLLMDVVAKSNKGRQRQRQCKEDGKVYFGYRRFRVSEVVNFCLDVAAKLMASA